MTLSVLHLDFQKDFRGTENQLLLLHDRLLADGIHSYALVLRGGELEERARLKETPHIYTVRHSRFSLGDFDPWMAAAVVEVCRRIKPSVIHAHGARASGILFFAKPFLSGNPRVVFHRTVTNPIPWRSRFKYRAAHGIIVVCEAIRKHLVAMGLKEEKIYVVPSGIPMGGCMSADEHGHESAGEKKEKGGGLVIGSLSALDKHQKDIATLIHAFALAARKHKNLKLLIFGDGPDRGNLEALAVELGLASLVEFRGWWNRPMEEAMEEIDIFALPSLYEGTSNVLITAMACGKPCIATEIGGNPEVLDGAGILVPARDPQAMAAALERLVEYPDQREEWGKKAKARSPEFSVEKMAMKTLSCYKKVLEKAL